MPVTHLYSTHVLLFTITAIFSLLISATTTAAPLHYQTATQRGERPLLLSTAKPRVVLPKWAEENSDLNFNLQNLQLLSGLHVVYDDQEGAKNLGSEEEDDSSLT